MGGGGAGDLGGVEPACYEQDWDGEVEVEGHGHGKPVGEGGWSLAIGEGRRLCFLLFMGGGDLHTRR